MVRHILKILQQILQDFQSVLDHLETLKEFLWKNVKM